MNENNWGNLIKKQMKEEYFIKIEKFLEENKDKVIYPPKEQRYNAFEKTSFEKVKVVIFGQDPYHGENQANGLAFSVNTGIKLPPSLKNIYKEIENEYNCKMSENRDLTKWANQGVLLLNATLTVEQSKANSHQKIGWQKFTDKIIEKLDEKEQPIVFILWGNNAKNKQKLIKNDKHLVLTSAHPSPLSAYNGFFGCNHFKLTNEFLEKTNQKQIDWQI